MSRRPPPPPPPPSLLLSNSRKMSSLAPPRPPTRDRTAAPSMYERDSDSTVRKRDSEFNSRDIINPKQHLNLLANDKSSITDRDGGVKPPISPIIIPKRTHHHHHHHRRKPPNPPMDATAMHNHQDPHYHSQHDGHKETKIQDFSYETYQPKESPFAYLNDMEGLKKKGPQRSVIMKSPKKLIVKSDESKGVSHSRTTITTTSSSTAAAAAATEANVEEAEEDEVKHEQNLGMSGWLYRVNEAYESRRVGEPFNRVWVLLAKNRLAYANHRPAGPNKEIATGYIDLGASTDVRVLYGDRSASSKNPVGKFCFQLREGDMHVVFSATSEVEREEWLVEIKEAIQGVVHSTPPDNFLVSTYEELDEMSNGRAHVMQEFPRKTGMLKKTAMNAYFGFRAIVNRYFRLDGGELSYYRDESMKPETLGKTFPLNSARLGQNNDELGITIILATGKVLELEAATPKLAHEWKELIGESIHAAQREGVGTGKKRRLNISNFEATELEAAAERNRKLEAGGKQYKSPKTIESIRLCLMQHFLMKSLSDLTPVLDALVEVVALPGDVIIWQGSHGDLFYILETGAAEIVKNGKRVGKIPAGKTFGELALLNSVARQATIKATYLCRLWTLDRDSFRKVLSDREKEVNNEKLAFLRNVKLFAQLSDSTLEKIVNVIFVRTYLQGERIFTQGEKGDCFYMIQSGKVMVTQQSSFTGGAKELVRLGAGKYFGEIALIEDAPRKATVTALEKTTCWILDKPNFENILGNMKQAVGESIALEILKHVKILSSLTEKQLTVISRSLLTKVYKEGDAIITQGEDGDSFFMIASGEVSVQVNHVEVAKLGPGKHFGEMSLLSNEKRSASIYAVSETTCLVLGRTEFVQLLGPLDSIMKEASERQIASSSDGGGEVSLFSMAKNMTMRRLGAHQSNSAGDAASKVSQVVSEYSDPMFQLDYLYRLRLLGVGTFGSVHLVQHTNGKQYAMKVMFKEIVIQMRQYNAVMREREIIKSMDHPFVAAMYATMQDADTLYLVQEYIPGGDFWSFLYSSKSNFSINKKTGGLKGNHILFYASNVLSIISYLHDNDVAFRDLKPENLVLDHSGYLKLIDFGCAQRVSSHNKLNTMVGTPEYIAPEVVLSKGHNRAVDLWGFGILLFEMATRGTPFEHDNAAMIYQSVIDSKEVLMKLFKTINGKGKKGIDVLLEDLILKLLEDNPNMRLGMLRNGIADIWSHPFFASHGCTEQKVRHRGAQTPYIPHAEDEGSMLDAVLLDAIDAKAHDAPKYTKSADFSAF